MVLALTLPKALPINIQLEFEETEERQRWEGQSLDPEQIQTFGHRDKTMMRILIWDNFSEQCQRFRMFSSLQAENIPFLNTQNLCLNSALVFNDQKSDSFLAYLENESFLRFEGLSPSEEYKDIYFGQSSWQYKNLAVTYAESTKDDPSVSHFVVYRPGLSLIDSPPGSISLPIWAQVFYKKDQIVDVNVGVDLGEFTLRQKKRLSGIFLAPKLDDEGRRFMWASFEE